MSVPLELMNVIVRRSAVERSYPGGVAQFEREVPNATYCADKHLLRLGFMGTDLEEFVEMLQRRALRLSAEGGGDLCVVDELSLPTTGCAWLRCETSDQLHARCWWVGDEPGELVVPERWPGATDRASASIDTKGSEAGPTAPADQHQCKRPEGLRKDQVGRDDPSIHVIDLGELSPYPTSEIIKRVAELIESGTKHFIIDLPQAFFLADSSVVGVITKAVKSAGVSVALVCPNEDVKKTLEITGLDRIFPIYSSRREDLAATEDRPMGGSTQKAPRAQGVGSHPDPRFSGQPDLTAVDKAPVAPRGTA